MTDITTADRTGGEEGRELGKLWAALEKAIRQSHQLERVGSWSLYGNTYRCGGCNYTCGDRPSVDHADEMVKEAFR